jgi:hypothetical protein
VTNSPCREWQGAKTRGYGVRTVRGRQVRVHRWVIASIHGWEAIEGKVVMHLCNNPACFRYDHLRIGTQGENNAHRDAQGRHGSTHRTHCPAGHPYDQANTRITPEGWRACRTCGRITANRWKANRKMIS